MIGRLWTLWQDIDSENRQFALNGTGSIFSEVTVPELC